MARRQSLTTHAAPEAVDGCALLARIVTRAIATGDGATSLAPSVESTWTPALQAVAAGHWRGKTDDAFASTGYVVHTLEAALWAVGRAVDFRDAIRRAVNLGHDADTVGAVAGPIAGALFRRRGTPAAWLGTLHASPRIEGMAGALLAQALPGSPPAG
ncbi:ADP-ribosylglycohydrolase family protein (plasmid) [Azospirillum brasilense]|nr:ADP-ribosylglycohydrolase family protein [Azospirillum brasilense]